MKLLIAIPALNEEDSIQSIIERTLAAREPIIAGSPIDDVEITVVSDGSTDGTVERASSYKDRIRLVVFPENRGYGAAIKEAWNGSDADVLGFLDADGTCEPAFFAPLCRALVEQDADVVLGCRLNRDSQMPAVRRLGNLLFATILSAFSAKRVRDTASGMRVVRRSSLVNIFPLPDGLHFTPAMSARALLNDRLRIAEIDMPYHERAGESKLRVLKDGLRFLKVILETTFLYRPSRPLGILAVVLLVGAVVLMLRPIGYYLRNRSVLEWMIYRFLVSNLLATTSCLCLAASYLTDRMASIALSGEVSRARAGRAARFFRSRYFWAAPAGFVLLGAALVLASLLQLLSTGSTYEHWSRYVVMTFCFSVAIILVLTRGMDYVLSLVEERERYLRAALRSHSTLASCEQSVEEG